MSAVQIEKTISVSLTPRELAEAFCLMGDEAQAQFFIEIAEIVKGWSGIGETQWLEVGRHLRDCKCSNESARDVVRDIAIAIGESP